MHAHTQPALSFDEVISVVDDPASYQPWRADFERSGAYVDRPDLQVPAGRQLRARCESFSFPPPATDALVEQRRTWDPPAIRRLGAHLQWMVWERYSPEGTGLSWPLPPRVCPLLHAYALLGLATVTRTAHRELGIPDDVTAATLWDIGEQVAIHQRIHGHAGMNAAWWLARHLALHLFALGRLQFERTRARRDLGPIAAGTPYLDVHIPESGPLTPEACDASFAATPPFFARFFPEDGARWFVCDSWLLDPQLAGLLPGESNIVRFQRRFELVSTRRDGGRSFEFVFDRPDLDPVAEPDLSKLPRRTALERALCEFVESGRRLQSGIGVIPIGADGTRGAAPW